MTETSEHIRAAVRARCAGFGGDAWRQPDASGAYPEQFVNSLTEAGFLAALISEEFGGSEPGLRAVVTRLEEVAKSGRNRAACHAQKYTMGAILRHVSPSRKESLLPESPGVSCGLSNRGGR